MDERRNNPRVEPTPVVKAEMALSLLLEMGWGAKGFDGFDFLRAAQDIRNALNLATFLNGEAAL